MSDPTLCKELVRRGKGWGLSTHQCPRKHTQDGYCHQHHPDRQKERMAKWETGWVLERAAQDVNEKVTGLERSIIATLLSNYHVSLEAVDALRAAKAAADEANVRLRNHKNGGTK